MMSLTITSNGASMIASSALVASVVMVTLNPAARRTRSSARPIAGSSSTTSTDFSPAAVRTGAATEMVSRGECALFSD
jgi:hypothetical protein